MADHVRQQLVDAVVTRLTGLATTAARVFADRPEDYALQESELPALLIYDDGESSVDQLLLSPLSYLRTVELRVAGIVKSVAGASNTARTICKEVEAALAAALTVDGRAVDAIYRGTEVTPPDAASDRPVVRVTLSFQVQLATAAAAPDALIFA